MTTPRRLVLALAPLLLLATPHARAQYRGYDNPGYDNRGYGNQGYGNQGYDNRGYDNRGNGNRGYEDRRSDDRRRDEGGSFGGRSGGNVPGGSYLASCGDGRMQGSTLVAVCRGRRGERYQTVLDTSRCGRSDIGNDNGTLQCSGARGSSRRLD